MIRLTNTLLARPVLRLRQTAMAALVAGAALLPSAGWAQGSAPAVMVAQPASSFSAAVATDWMQLDLLLVQQTPGFSPPVAARALGYLGLTLYESMVPGMPQYRSLSGQLNELESLPWAQPDEPLHWPTVANAAMAAMSRMMFSNASAENKAKIDQLERNIPIKWERDFDPATVTPDITNRSETFGRLMAMAIMTWARTDGGHEAWGPLRRSRQNYVPPSGPGKWSPTPPAFAPALLPWWGEVRPFVLKSAAVCEAPPPPPYSEDPQSVLYKEAVEVYNVAKQATQEQRQFALYWADDPLKTPTPAGHWAYIANDVLKQRKADLAQAAQTYVQLNLAMADAFIAGWRTKYLTNVLRPVTYVQLLIDSNWTPELMPTPPFPDYPSGHSVQSSAASGVLSQLFGADTAFTDNAHNDRGWGPRTFKSFKAAANEAALSRMYGGIHYRNAVVGGQVQGECVAQQVLALKLKR